MKLALVTTPWGAPSPVGEWTGELVRHLADQAQIDVFVERGLDGREYLGRTTRAAPTLLPREYDQVLYALGDETGHAFMLPVLRALGGCVDLHAWRLSRLAFAAYPCLQRGGVRAAIRALSEGGVADARRVWSRRRSATRGESSADESLLLNRSVVRFGDAFIVPSTEMGELVLDDRNAPTPLAVIAHGATDSVAAWQAIALAYLEALAKFPLPRSARRGFVTSRVLEGLRARRAR